MNLFEVVRLRGKLAKLFHSVEVWHPMLLQAVLEKGPKGGRVRQCVIHVEVGSDHPVRLGT